MKKLAMASPQPKRPLGRPKKILDHRKLDSIVEVLPESPVALLETLLIFDARCLDKETRQELIRILPQLVHIRHAWKAEYMECGASRATRRGLSTVPADSAMRAVAGFTSGCGTATGRPSRAAISRRSLQRSRTHSACDTTPLSSYSIERTNESRHLRPSEHNQQWPRPHDADARTSRIRVAPRLDRRQRIR
jgi:hypothetical protein